MTTVVNVRFAFRRDTATNWTSVNPVLADGEAGLDKTSGKIKIGDGTTVWASLPYWSPMGYTAVNIAGDTMTGRLIVPRLQINGTGGSFSAWTTGGVGLIQSPATWTDATSTGTVANVIMSLFGAQTMAASNAVTVTTLYGAYFVAPAAGTNVTAPTRWALGADSIFATTATISNGFTAGNQAASLTISIGNGLTSSGNTKTVAIGTGGLSGSITNVTLGSGSGTVNIYQSQQAPTSKSAAATLSAAELAVRLIQYTGAAAALTMPTGTDLDSGNAAMASNTSFDFSVINTGSGTATMTANTGVTIVGSAAVAAGTSALFRLRRTGAATYVLYCLS